MMDERRDPAADAEGMAYDADMTEPDEANAPDESEAPPERVAPDAGDRAMPPSDDEEE